jgi:hypothetical protein
MAAKAVSQSRGISLAYRVIRVIESSRAISSPVTDVQLKAVIPPKCGIEKIIEKF